MPKAFLARKNRRKRHFDDGNIDEQEEGEDEDDTVNSDHNEKKTAVKQGCLKVKTTINDDPPVVVLYDTEKDLNSRTFLCIYCNKHFETRYQLKRHLLTHSGKRQHVCEVCQAAFVLSSSLWHHMQTHSTRKNHICTECGQSFLRSTGLRLHRKTHTTSKDHVCNICGKAFHQKGNLKAHINAHKGIRPYRCMECGKSYSQLSNMKRHMWTWHQQKKVFGCLRCNAAFEKQKELHMHEQISHRGVIKSSAIGCESEQTDIQLQPVTISEATQSHTDWHQLLPSMTSLNQLSRSTKSGSNNQDIGEHMTGKRLTKIIKSHPHNEVNDCMSGTNITEPGVTAALEHPDNTKQHKETKNKVQNLQKPSTMEQFSSHSMKYSVLKDHQNQETSISGMRISAGTNQHLPGVVASELKVVGSCCDVERNGMQCDSKTHSMGFSKQLSSFDAAGNGAASEPLLLQGGSNCTDVECCKKDPLSRGEGSIGYVSRCTGSGSHCTDSGLHCTGSGSQSTVPENVDINKHGEDRMGNDTLISNHKEKCLLNCLVPEIGMESVSPVTVSASTTCIMTITAPVMTNTASMMINTAPVMTNTAPILTSIAPIRTTTAPVMINTAPIMTSIARIRTTTAPVMINTAPIMTSIAPIRTTIAPVMTNTAPVLINTAPIMTSTAPIMTSTAPILISTAPIINRTTPVMINTDPLMTTTCIMPVVTCVMTTTSCGMPVTMCALTVTCAACCTTLITTCAMTTTANILSTASYFPILAPALAHTRPLSTYSIPQSTTSVPLSTNAPIPSTNALPPSTNALPPSTNVLPLSTNVLPLSTTALPLSAHTLALFSNTIPVSACPKSPSVSTVRLPKATPVSVGKLPLSKQTVQVSSYITTASKPTQHPSTHAIPMSIHTHPVSTHVLPVSGSTSSRTAQTKASLHSQTRYSPVAASTQSVASHVQHMRPVITHALSSVIPETENTQKPVSAFNLTAAKRDPLLTARVLPVKVHASSVMVNTGSKAEHGLTVTWSLPEQDSSVRREERLQLASSQPMSVSANGKPVACHAMPVSLHPKAEPVIIKSALAPLQTVTAVTQTHALSSGSCPSIKKDNNVLCVPSQTCTTVPLLQQTVPLYTSVDMPSEHPLLLMPLATLAPNSNDLLGSVTTSLFTSHHHPTVAFPVLSQPVPLYSALTSSSNTHPCMITQSDHNDPVTMTTTEQSYPKDKEHRFESDVLPSKALPRFQSAQTSIVDESDSFKKCCSLTIASVSVCSELQSESVQSLSSTCDRKSKVSNLRLFTLNEQDANVSLMSSNVLRPANSIVLPSERPQYDCVNSLKSAYNITSCVFAPSENLAQNNAISPMRSGNNNIVSSVRPASSSQMSSVKPNNEYAETSARLGNGNDETSVRPASNERTPSVLPSASRCFNSRSPNQSSAVGFTVVQSVNSEDPNHMSTRPGTTYTDSDVVIPVSVSIDGCISTVFMLASMHNHSVPLSTKDDSHSDQRISGQTRSVTRSERSPTESFSSGHPRALMAESCCRRAALPSITASLSSTVTMTTGGVVQNAKDVVRDSVTGKEVTSSSSQEEHTPVAQTCHGSVTVVSGGSRTPGQDTRSHSPKSKSQQKTQAFPCSSGAFSDLPDVSNMLEAVNTQATAFSKLFSVQPQAGAKSGKSCGARLRKSSGLHRSQFRCLPGDKDLTVTMYTPDNRTPVEFIIRAEQNQAKQNEQKCKRHTTNGSLPDGSSTNIKQTGRGGYSKLNSGHYSSWNMP